MLSHPEWAIELQLRIDDSVEVGVACTVTEVSPMLSLTEELQVLVLAWTDLRSIGQAAKTCSAWRPLLIKVLGELVRCGSVCLGRKGDPEQTSTEDRCGLLLKRLQESVEIAPRLRFGKWTPGYMATYELNALGEQEVLSLYAESIAGLLRLDGWNDHTMSQVLYALGNMRPSVLGPHAHELFNVLQMHKRTLDVIEGLKPAGLAPWVERMLSALHDETCPLSHELRWRNRIWKCMHELDNAALAPHVGIIKDYLPVDELSNEWYRQNYWSFAFCVDVPGALRLLNKIDSTTLAPYADRIQKCLQVYSAWDTCEAEKLMEKINFS